MLCFRTVGYNSITINYYRSIIITKINLTSLDLFFNSDLIWCKQNFPGDFEFIDESVELLDFQEFELYKLCKHQIIANSTFSWRMVWLNENQDKIVIAPEKWHANSRLKAKYRNGNLITDSWINL